MKKRKNKHKKILYLKWLEENKIETEIEDISEKVCVDKEKVVIKKESFLTKAFDYFVNGLIVLVKLVLILFFMALLSLAITVLINPTLREFVFDTLRGLK